ncbi:SipW-dependent-type signal peptide-containing protein [Blautia sp.]|nr:SipW-dependent-type signal peptide-containing protein [uncultured Blautia sp.]
MRISREKRNILFAGAISCAMLFGIGNTMAYFTENAVQTNVFTTGDLDIGLKEPGWDPEDNDGKNMYPGYTVYKNPTVKNITSDKNGDEPCYVRMTVDILNNQGSPVTDNQALNLIYKTIYFDKTFNGSYDKKEGYGTGLVQDRIPGYSLAQLASYPMVNPLWVKDTSRSTASSLVFNYMGEKGDGILDIGEESTLFTNVVIPTDWNQTQMQKVGNYQLKVTAQAIQSKGFASQSEAYRMLDEEIKGGTLQEIERDSQN